MHYYKQSQEREQYFLKDITREIANRERKFPQKMEQRHEARGLTTSKATKQWTKGSTQSAAWLSERERVGRLRKGFCWVQQRGGLLLNRKANESTTKGVNHCWQPQRSSLSGHAKLVKLDVGDPLTVKMARSECTCFNFPYTFHPPRSPWLPLRLDTHLTTVGVIIYPTLH